VAPPAPEAGAVTKPARQRYEVAVELTRQERRALRAIEEALAAEDPVLAELLREPPALRRVRLLRRVTWVVAAIAVIFLLMGLLVSDAFLLFAGALMLLALWAIRRWASRSPGGRRRP
jgi:cobalamin synthase